MIVRTTPDENGTQWETAEVTLLTVDATRIPRVNDVDGEALDVDAVAEEVVQAAYRKAHDLIHDHTGLEYFGDATPGEVADMTALAGMVVRSVLVNGPKVGDDVAAVWSATGRNLLDPVPGRDEKLIGYPHGVVANVLWEDGGDNTEWFAQILNEAKGHWDGATFWADAPFNLSEDEDPPLIFQYGFFGGITVHAPTTHSDSELERLLWRSPYIGEGWNIDSFDAAVPRREAPDADTVDLGPPREILVHLNVRAPEDTNAETLASEILGAIEVGTDADMTPDLFRSHVVVADTEEI